MEDLVLRITTRPTEYTATMLQELRHEKQLFSGISWHRESIVESEGYLPQPEQQGKVMSIAYVGLSDRPSGDGKV